MKVNEKLKQQRLGETTLNHQGYMMTIVEYRKATDISVDFGNGCCVPTRYDHFKTGVVSNPLHPSWEGKGYISIGKYKAKENGKDTEAFKKWHSMLARCYSQSYICKEAYSKCSVSEEFLNFQNFAEFYYSNLWQCDKPLTVDKDILSHETGNKIYSRETILLVDARINSLFINCKQSRGALPIGVTAKSNKFYAYVSKIVGENKYKQQCVGAFQTPQEAFEAYKLEKENYIKQVADEYKQKYIDFPQKIYDAMYNYEININD